GLVTQDPLPVGESPHEQRHRLVQPPRRPVTVDRRGGPSLVMLPQTSHGEMGTTSFSTACPLRARQNGNRGDSRSILLAAAAYVSTRHVRQVRWNSPVSRPGLPGCHSDAVLAVVLGGVQSIRENERVTEVSPAARHPP